MRGVYRFAVGAIAAGALLQPVQASVDVKKALEKQTTSAVCGIARNANDDPVAEVGITLSKKGRTTIVAAGKTDSSGSYSIESVSPGKYVVAIEPPKSYRGASQELEVRNAGSKKACRLNIFLCLHGMECVTHLWTEKK